MPLPADADAQHWADVVMEEYHATLKDRGPEGKAYLAKRGLLNDELIATFKPGVANRTLGYRLPRMETSDGAVIRGTLQQLGYLRPSGHEHFRGCLTVPILDEDGHVTGMYGRRLTPARTPEQPVHLYLPGPHKGVWNRAAFQHGAELILCEAALDALMFWVHGFQHVTFSYGVAGFTADHLAALQAYHITKVLIAYDADAAGDHAAEQLAARLTPLGIACARVEFPAGGIGDVAALEALRLGKMVNGSLVQGFLYETQLEPVAELDGSGNRVISYSYDTSDNVTAITPPGRPPHEFTYTAVNLEKDYLAPFVSSGGTNTTSYTYDVDRRVTRITRPDGQQVTLTYDPAGRLSAQVFPSPQPLTPNTLSYAYNAQGNLNRASLSGGGAVNYTYDGSLLLSSSWSGPVSGSVSWTYDNNYRKTSQSVNGGNTITFGYDTDDLLTGAGAMTLTRDSVNGLLSGTTLGTVAESLTYNSLGEVATATSSVGGSALLSETYTRDSLGRISTKTETIQGVTTTSGYTYDVAGRLTEVKQNGLTVATYAYDANSNRLSTTKPGGTTTYTYDAQDRLLTQSSVSGPPSVSYAYTANGELSTVTRPLSPVPSSYAYDALGNLRTATLSDGTEVGYVIDGENRRVGKQVNGSLVQGFLYENQLEPVAELDGSGNLVSRFVYADCSTGGCNTGGCGSGGCGHSNVPQYMLKNGVTYRILSDHLGSPRLVVDATSGATVQQMDYDEFGTVITDTNPGFQPFGFAGGIYDRDTGLTRFGARDYDPETGRWTAKDPIGFEGGLNLYGYVLNDPVNKIDPSGLMAAATLGGQFAGAALKAVLVTFAILAVGTILAAVIEKLDDGCMKASKFQLKAAGIYEIYGGEHGFKTFWGAEPWGHYDICACKDGSIVIKGVGQCGRRGGGIPTDARWK